MTITRSFTLVLAAITLLASRTGSAGIGIHAPKIVKKVAKGAAGVVTNLPPVKIAGDVVSDAKNGDLGVHTITSFAKDVALAQMRAAMPINPMKPFGFDPLRFALEHDLIDLPDGVLFHLGKPYGYGRDPGRAPAGIAPPRVLNCSFGTFQKLGYEPPDMSGAQGAIVTGLNRALFPATADFDNHVADAMAKNCRDAYPGDSWRQIQCASASVHQFILQDAPPGTKELKSALTLYLRTWCMTHARAFDEVVSKLGLPGVDAGERYVEGHVLNTITVHAQDGGTYEYAMDVGNHNGVLVPYNDAAKSRMGGADNACNASTPLPTLDRRELPSAGAAAGMAAGLNRGTPATGSNTGRTSSTVPPVSIATGANSPRGTTGGAGVHH